jgi:hypothetical protein
VGEFLSLVATTCETDRGRAAEERARMNTFEPEHWGMWQSIGKKKTTTRHIVYEGGSRGPARSTDRAMARTPAHATQLCAACTADHPLAPHRRAVLCARKKKVVSAATCRDTMIVFGFFRRRLSGERGAWLAYIWRSFSFWMSLYTSASASLRGLRASGKTASCIHHGRRGGEEEEREMGGLLLDCEERWWRQKKCVTHKENKRCRGGVNVNRGLEGELLDAHAPF